MYSAQSGYRTQGDAGLSLVGARCYDAQVGRFITRDTLLDQKTYLYCEHDPVNATDPSGHFGGFWEIVGVLVGGVGVVIEAPVLIVVAGVAEFGGVEERRSIYHLSGVNAALFRDLGECCLVGSERL
jgi:RHS repeat-associated protein